MEGSDGVTNGSTSPKATYRAILDEISTRISGENPNKKVKVIDNRNLSNKKNPFNLNYDPNSKYNFDTQAQVSIDSISALNSI